MRLEQKVGASDAITRSKAEKVDQLEQNVGILQAEVAHEKRERVGAEEKVGQLSEKVRVLQKVLPAPDVGVGMALEELTEKSSTTSSLSTSSEVSRRTCERVWSRCNICSPSPRFVLNLMCASVCE